MLSQWMYDQIDEQLAPFRERGISRASLDSVKRAYAYKYDENFIRFIVRGGALTWQARRDLFPNYNEARFQAVHRAIAAIAGDLPDIEFELYLSGGFTGWSKPEAAPVFSYCRHRTKDRTVILFPDPSSLGDADRLRREVRAGSDANSWETKIEKCFFRGGTNGGFTPEKYKSALRYRFVELAMRHPDEMDVGFSSTANCAPEVAEIINAEGFFKGKTPLRDHMAFKYLALIDGFVAAWQRNFWNFHTNSVTFKHDSDLVIWFDRGVRANVHFVPIANDFSDTAEKVRMARANDGGMQQIAKNAQDFAASDLTDAMVSAYLKELLTRYGEIYRA